MIFSERLRLGQLVSIVRQARDVALDGMSGLTGYSEEVLVLLENGGLDDGDVSEETLLDVAESVADALGSSFSKWGIVLGLTDEENNFERDLDRVLETVRTSLIAKNKQYGDSALNPVRVFSKASTEEQLYVRMDDKLSRLVRGDADLDVEDVKADLLGYLLLDQVREWRLDNADTE